MAFSTRANTLIFNQSVAHRFRLFALVVIGIFAASLGFAQQKSDFAGEYAGMLGPVHVKLHIVAGPGGSITANVDSPDQNLYALPCSDLSINGQALSFSVPNVRGEWTGVLSADHNSLSGVWKQGSPMALTFTRGGVGTSDNSPHPAQSANIAPPSAISYSQTTPCATMLGASYWDGAAWKTMIMAAHLGGETGASITEGLKGLGRNPFNSRAGFTTILTFKNPAAALSLKSSPKFCVSVPPNIDPSVVMIGKIEVKKDHRELETCAGPCASKGRNADDWMPAKRVQPVDIKRISDNTVEITPKSPLQPGQYILGGPPLIGYYDFGIDAQ